MDNNLYDFTKCTIHAHYWATCLYIYDTIEPAITQCTDCAAIGPNTVCPEPNEDPARETFDRRTGHVEYYPDGSHTGYCWRCRMDEGNAGKNMWNDCWWLQKKKGMKQRVVEERMGRMEKLK